MADTNILISTPFHPAYMTKERLAKAKNLELLVTAGVGSDHIDLHEAADRGLTVSEVTGMSSQSHFFLNVKPSFPHVGLMVQLSAF